MAQPLEAICEGEPHPSFTASTLGHLHSSSIRITERGYKSTNPTPLEDRLQTLHLSIDVADHFLSPSKLRVITGVNDLSKVVYLELSVDTSVTSLGNFGVYLHHLTQLRLYNSYIQSIRDLGTSLNLLKVLWMARCQLRDLDGLAALPSLQEFYIAHNNVRDISLISLLNELEVLDIEKYIVTKFHSTTFLRNFLSEIDQLGYLCLCPLLTVLTLSGNPITQSLSTASTLSYRESVHELIPQLKVLDDIPYEEIDISNSSYSLMSPSLVDGWRSMCKGSISISPLELHDKAIKKHIQNENTDESSDLTHGLNQVICGNPVKALRARHQNDTVGTFTPSIEIQLTNASTPDLLSEDITYPIVPFTLPPNRPRTACDFRARRYQKAKEMSRSHTAMPSTSRDGKQVIVSIATHAITLPNRPRPH